MPRSSKSEGLERFAVKLRARAPLLGLLKGLGLEKGRTPERAAKIIEMVKMATSHVLEKSRITDNEERNSIISNLAEAIFNTLESKGHIKFSNKEGLSTLDVITLGLSTEDEVKHFLEINEIDYDKEEDREYLRRIFDEAIEVYNQYVREAGERKVDKSLTETDSFEGIARIFLTESGNTDHRQLIPQACGIVRIAAAINHMEMDPRLALLPEAEKKLKELMTKHFPSTRINGEKRYHFQPCNHSPYDIPMSLVKAEARTKDRSQIILKLLHKPENRASEVVDSVGMRFITHSPMDTLKLIYLMFYHPHHSIIPGNSIIIDETTQLMFDEDALREAIADPDQAERMVRALEKPHKRDDETIELELNGGNSNTVANQHSANNRRAIQLTAEVPMRIDTSGEKKRRLVRTFPFEIQIADIHSHTQNERGDGSHPAYKERQLKSIRPRVKGKNTLTAFEESQK